MFDFDEEVQVLSPEELFYSQKLYFSYSALKKLIWSPQVYYKHYILGEKEESLEKHLIEGKVIHCNLLNSHLFEELFVVSNINVPSGNSKMIVEKMVKLYEANTKQLGDANEAINLADYSENILTLMKDMDYFQALADDKPKKNAADAVFKTGNQKRLEKVVTEETVNYFNFLKAAGTKNVIDEETVRYCKEAAEVISNDPTIRMLLGIDKTDDVINEKEFRVDLGGYPFGVKGIIDNVNIDHEAKLIYINDIKTTGKDLTDFPETVEFYKYWMQAVIYVLLIEAFYKNLMRKGYKIKFHFIVIDRNLQLYPFKVGPQTLKIWNERFIEILNKANYHYTERSYRLPYEFEKGLIVL